FSIRESGSISEVGRRPRCSSRSLELRAPVSRDAHTGVEHGSFAGNLARLDAVCELLACRPLDAGSRTVEDAAAANESASHRPLQLLERPKQAVDRAADAFSAVTSTPTARKRPSRQSRAQWRGTPCAFQSARN